jgi:hypothetical protein
MSDVPSAFYHRDGDRLVPSALCIGPWDARFQHGGPPSALLARAVLADAPDTLRIARITVDLLRPIPLVPLRATATTIRAGRLAHWVDAHLLDDDDRLLARATATLIRRDALTLPPAETRPLPPPPSPDGVTPWIFPFFPAPIAYHRGVEIRFVEGQWPRTPTTAWMELTRPLVDGEPTTPTIALLALADAVNGLHPAVLDLGLTFVNADVSVQLGREPEGARFAFAARALADPSGMGATRATIFDAAGELGHAAQSLVVARRG